MADEQTRDTPWRQGQILDPNSAHDLGLTFPGDEPSHLVVVITHDCDIANDATREPHIEVIVSRRIDKVGADANAKTARRLHIEYESANGTVALELNATGKRQISKEKLLETEPSSDWMLPPEGLVILQKWLASRYYRAAFADEFQDRMKVKPSRVDKKLANALDEPGIHILAVLFDVDGGVEIPRSGADDVYQLHITLLYDSTQDEPSAFKAASKAVQVIEDAFEKAFFQENGSWKQIQLLSCTVMSDSAMTIADSRLLKQWPLDYMSLDADPQQPTLR